MTAGDASYVVTVTTRNELDTWNVREDALESTVRLPAPATALAAVLHGDSVWAMVGGADGGIHVWDTSKESNRFRVPRGFHHGSEGPHTSGGGLQLRAAVQDFLELLPVVLAHPVGAAGDPAGHLAYTRRLRQGWVARGAAEPLQSLMRWCACSMPIVSVALYRGPDGIWGSWWGLPKPRVVGTWRR